LKLSLKLLRVSQTNSARNAKAVEKAIESGQDKKTRKSRRRACDNLKNVVNFLIRREIVLLRGRVLRRLGVALGVVLAVASNLGPQPMLLLGLVDARLL